jgi:hypothetical protein
MCRDLFEYVSLELVQMAFKAHRGSSINDLMRPDRKRIDIVVIGGMDEVEGLESGSVNAHTVVDQIAETNRLEAEGLTITE